MGDKVGCDASQSVSRSTAKQHGDNNTVSFHCLTVSQHQDKMEFTGLLLTLSSLTVSPNRSQFFKYESLSLSCEENRNSSGWRVKAKTERGVSECGRDWGSLRVSSCILNEAYSWNSGVYWCESTSGEKTPAANITVTENNVILESPVFPVLEGESVTLRCTAQSNSSILQPSIFMKGRSAVGAGITGQMTIPAVSKSDEGLYMCMITDVGASAESWLTVRERTKKRQEAGRPSGGFTGGVTEAAGPDGPAAPLMSVFRLICHLVVGSPYLLSTVLLGLIYRDKAKAQQVEETRNCDEVQMEEIM
ncbi:uncharacterized protein LOC118338056 [Morone saxatilis]|uniref:uncharacterized protein LOC118338056 n=1 Tax=Morone saxatilis TaxID=34816 RepID=UPI0015E2104D|nr:uncharacterized protein LOC118338056 [Morone saxatilis]